MSLLGRSVPVAVATVLILAATAASRTVDPPFASLAASTPVVHTSAAERARIHAHFDSVLTELESRDVHALSAAQHTQRAAVISTLRAYNARGVFPHNYDFPDTPTPYFVDRKTGTLCAVAHLLESTGRRDIVDRVAQMNNNVWVAQLAGDRAFEAWLDENGLTLAEAARIQVPYQDTPSQTKIVTYAAGAPIALVSSLGMSIWNATGNADGHRRSVTALGVLSGLSLSVIGGMLATEPDANGTIRGIGGTGAAIGGLTMALSVRGFRRHGRLMAAERAAESERERRVGPSTGAPALEASARAPRSAELVPLLTVGRNASAGAAMTIRF